MEEWTLRKVAVTMALEAGGWAVLMVLASLVLEYACGVRPFWLLLPLSCLAADLGMYAVRHLDGKYFTSNSPFRTWFLRQLTTWSAFAIAIRVLYGER